MLKLTIVSILICAGCTKAVDQCSSNADCTDPTYPFCDVDGQYPDSGGNKDVCTAIPPGCPVEQCGCVVGATTCSSNELSVCNSDGMSVTMSACALGCEDAGTTCKSFTPSNGLGPALVAAANEAPIQIPSGATIDTDTGTISDAGGNPVTVTSTMVAQSTASIRVFIAHSFLIGGVTVVGSYPVAFVAVGAVTINGHLDMSANGSTIGAGGQSGTPACAGTSTTADGSGNGPGPGGGGNATTGASGGGFMVAGNLGGVAVTGFDTLAGGCAGGTAVLGGTTDTGGAGGGAIQIVSATSVDLTGVIDVGGGGGSMTAGGGSGGLVIIETPSLMIGPAGGIAANGGGGGGGCNGGGDATPDNTPAAGGGIGCHDAYNGGAGGTGSAAPVTGSIQTTGTGGGVYGGGGGAAGRARLATSDGTLMSQPTSILSVLVTSDTLAVQ